MKKCFLGLFALLSTAVLLAQSGTHNDPNAELRSVAAFTGIKVSTGISLVLAQGNEVAVAVSAEKAEDRDNIKTEVKDGILRIYYESGLFKSKGKVASKLKAYVSATTLNKLHVTSGASINLEGTFKTTNMDIDLQSGAMLKGAFDADAMSVSQSSGAVAKLNGHVKSLAVKVNSGANFLGYELAVNQCNVSASSGGNVEITVNKELEAVASSGGNVRYKGTGSLTKAKTNSGGSIKLKA